MNDISDDSIEKIDRSKMLPIMVAYPNEIEHAYKIGMNCDLAISQTKLTKIVIIGMGGSAIGGDLLRCLVQKSCSLPVLVSRSYNAPVFIDEDTLVFVCSFSGNTEETLSSYQQLERTQAQVVCITSGGQLSQYARRFNHNLILIPNGRQPRNALSYLFLPMVAILQRLKLIASQETAIEEAVQVATKIIEQSNSNDGLIKRLALKLSRKLPIIYTSEHFEAIAMRWRCQFAENSQILAFSNVLPEMNHNEIMGWDPHTPILEGTQIVLLRDKDELSRIARRFEITKNILRQKLAIECTEVQSQGETLLARMFSLIIIGDFVSYYLAILNNVDPTEIENINILKNELAF